MEGNLMVVWLIVGVIAVIAFVLVGGLTYGISSDGNDYMLCLTKAIAYTVLALVTFLTEVAREVDIIDGVIFVAAVIEATANWIDYKKKSK